MVEAPILDRIDVHHHLVPPAFSAAMGRHDLAEVAGARLPDWTPQRSLRMMDDRGIAAAVLSLSAPGVHLGGTAAEAADLARACNDYAAEVVAAHPDRFGAFAVLPTASPDAACREACRALDELGADGVVLLGSTAGIFLGDPRLEDLMFELDRRAAVVFVHPNLHATSTQLGLEMPGFLLEFLCDTTRAAANLVLTGVLERFPRIRWILAHAGGFLPYVAWRLALANSMPAVAPKAPQGVLHYVRRFYFDTALSPSPFAMSALKALVDPEHILFGSDFPFAPETLVGVETRELEGLDAFDSAAQAGVARGHALALFPRFAVSAEPPPAGLVSQVRRGAKGRAAAIVRRVLDR